MQYIQSYILNIEPAGSLDKLKNQVKRLNGTLGVENLYQQAAIETPGFVRGFTAPRWAKEGDICFFMEAVSAYKRLRSLRKELFESRKWRRDRDYDKLVHALSESEIAYRAFGGKIFAVGLVNETPTKERNDMQLQSWRTNTYCDYESVIFLDEPISFSEFKEFVSFKQQGSITLVLGESYEKIKKLIITRNPKTKKLFRNCVSTPIPLTRIDKNNWLKVTYTHNFRFNYEDQFRRFYVDYLLMRLKDSGKLYNECYCANERDGKVDNVILFDGKYLPVEVKLKKDFDIASQLKKYYKANIHLEQDVWISGRDLHKAVLLIDTTGIFQYKRGRLNKIVDLKSIKTNKDIKALKTKLCALLK